MTDIGKASRTCSVCGAVSEQVELLSLSMTGLRDLDWRPSGVPLIAYIQHCPECGFSARDIEQEIPGAEEFVEREDYRACLSEPRLELSGWCRAYGLLAAEVLEDFSLAGDMCKVAAWICDSGLEKDDFFGGSNPDPEQAKIYREQAVNYYQKAREEGQTFAEDSWMETAILVDLLRRARRWSDAEALVQQELEQAELAMADDVFKFQRTLIEEKDDAVHTLHEAEEAGSLKEREQERRKQLEQILDSEGLEIFSDETGERLTANLKRDEAGNPLFEVVKPHSPFYTDGPARAAWLAGDGKLEIGGGMIPIEGDGFTGSVTGWTFWKFRDPLPYGSEIRELNYLRDEGFFD